MLAPNARTNLPVASNFWIGGTMEFEQSFDAQWSNTQMLFPSPWSTCTLMVCPNFRPSGELRPVFLHPVAIGAYVGIGTLGVGPVSRNHHQHAGGDATINLMIAFFMVVLPSE